MKIFFEFLMKCWWEITLNSFDFRLTSWWVPLWVLVEFLKHIGHRGSNFFSRMLFRWLFSYENFFRVSDDMSVINHIELTDFLLISWGVLLWVLVAFLKHIGHCVSIFLLMHFCWLFYVCISSDLVMCFSAVSQACIRHLQCTNLKFQELIVHTMGNVYIGL